MSKVRWGVLSTAKIGTEKVLPAMQQAEFCEVAAIASRTLDSAQAAAQRLGIAKAYGSYEALLDDPEVDAIYIPLPNHLHVPWSIKALEAGKHVLCEKPIGLSSEEGQQLVDAGKRFPKLKLMEAFMYRHHPQWQRAREIVKSGGIGKLCTIQSTFSYFNNDGSDIRNKPEIGGGGLMDIGCYPISLSRFIFEAEPKQVAGATQLDPNFGTDRLSSAILEFEAGTSVFTCSTQMAKYQRVNIFGDLGRVELEIPFNAPSDRPTRVWHQHADEVQEILFETCDQYGIQGDLFSQAILNDTPVPTPIEDAVSNMKVIEAIFQAAQTGTWTAL